MMDDESQSTPVQLERLIGGMSRVETKLDVSLADMQRRVTAVESESRGLHGRVTTLAQEVSTGTARTDALVTRVGAAEQDLERQQGAFARYAPIAISFLALVFTAFAMYTAMV